MAGDAAGVPARWRVGSAWCRAEIFGTGVKRSRGRDFGREDKAATEERLEQLTDAILDAKSLKELGLKD
jgi:hypothetical protein